MLSKQKAFAELVSRFIPLLVLRGYTVTLGEAWRSDDTAKLEAELGKGISNSLHRIRLAIDLNLFRGEQLLNRLADYQEAGELWESFSTDELSCCWGGRFSRPDADHFSIEHEGVK